MRLACAITHAGRRGARFAPSAFVSTIAAAPSDEGHDSRKCSGSQSIGLSRTFSMLMSGRCRCAYGFLSAFLRSFTATFQPMCSGAPLFVMYWRIHGANDPPAPWLPLRPPPSAQVALPSLCFS